MNIHRLAISPLIVTGLVLGLLATPSAHAQLEMKSVSYYCGKYGIPPFWKRDFWLWRVYVDGSDSELQKIQRVTYHLHSTFDPPTREVTQRITDASGLPFSPPVFRGWEGFRITADVIQPTGLTQLTHYLTLSQQTRDYLQDRTASKVDLQLCSLRGGLECKNCAAVYERNGFEALLDERANDALYAFSEAYRSWQTYHNVDEIREYLQQNLRDLNTTQQWSRLYKKILDDWSWGMPDDVKTRMKHLLSRTKNR